MNCILKWKLNKQLSDEEKLKILIELFYGANKKLNYDINTPINKSLYKLFESFPESDGSCTLRFSSTETERPFVSFNEFSNYSHRIGEMYVYE